MAARAGDEPHYTPFYCEENVYQLLASLERSSPFSRSFAVFVSNLDRHALLFEQQASRQGPEQGHSVVWDYHVVAVAVERAEVGQERVGAKRVVVLDRDSRLGAVVPLRGASPSLHLPAEAAQALTRHHARRLCRPHVPARPVRLGRPRAVSAQVSTRPPLDSPAHR